MPTPDTKLPFGKHKGLKLNQCPTDYLQWMAGKLGDSDFSQWAQAAREVLKTKKAGEAQTQNLEQAADDFLKKHGINPKKPGA